MNLTNGDIALVVVTLGLSMVVGAGLLQALFIMPEYFSDPPSSLRRFQNDKSFLFWLPLHALILVALTFALILEWDTERQSLLLWAATCYAACWAVTFAFFIPGVVAFNKVDVDGPPDAELAAKGAKWLRLSWSRHALMAASAVSALLAITQ
jgi:hypothetical protein